MSLTGMDLGPKMDWTLDNWLYLRFKVFKERCIDILSGPLHVIPEENQVYCVRYLMGEEGSKLISQWMAEGKITDDDDEVTSKKKLKTIGNSLKTMLNQGQIVFLQLWNLKGYSGAP